MSDNQNKKLDVYATKETNNIIIRCGVLNLRKPNWPTEHRRLRVWPTHCISQAPVFLVKLRYIWRLWSDHNRYMRWIRIFVKLEKWIKTVFLECRIFTALECQLHSIPSFELQSIRESIGTILTHSFIYKCHCIWCCKWPFTVGENKTFTILFHVRIEPPEV